ncbi:MAG: response regulator, partial [Deltaproteobacteria bacterium]|nr:response regulator [Deltaproteobacteria bacterium]
IIDIMGVDGYNILKIANKKNMIAVILTAHALSPDNLVKSYSEGAVSFVPKEKMANLPALLNEIWENAEKGRDYLWDCWLQQIDTFLEKKFGPEWQNEDNEFSKKFKPKKQ